MPNTSQIKTFGTILKQGGVITCDLLYLRALGAVAVDLDALIMHDLDRVILQFGPLRVAQPAQPQHNTIIKRKYEYPV